MKEAAAHPAAERNMAKSLVEKKLAAGAGQVGGWRKAWARETGQDPLAGYL